MRTHAVALCRKGVSKSLGFFILAALFLLCSERAGFAEVIPVPSEELLKQSRYTSATFSYSTEPDKLLIFLSSSGMAMHQRTVGLYGDGRLVFRKTYGEQIAEEEIVEIDPQEIQRILRSAVDFGLAEWDLTRVQSKQIEKNNGELYTVIPSDASQDLILISLLDYERGSYRVPRIERKIRFRGASFADRRLPSILEIRGIVELKRELYRFREKDRRP